MRTHILLLTGLLAGAAVAESGPATGAAAPLLHVDAVNDQGGTYCITCRAGRLPAIITFVTAASDDLAGLVRALDQTYRSGQDRRLHAAVVVVGDGEHAETVRQLLADSELKVPTAFIDPDHRELPNWKLDEAAATTTVIINRHTVQASVINLTAEELPEQTKIIGH